MMRSNMTVLKVVSFLYVSIFAGHGLSRPFVSSFNPDWSVLFEKPLHQPEKAVLNHGRLNLKPRLPREVTTIIIVPQLHRHDHTPIHWSSLGRDVKSIQVEIATFIYTLGLENRHIFLGTEGTPYRFIPKSIELERLSWRLHDLKQFRTNVLNDIYPPEQKTVAPILSRCEQHLFKAVQLRTPILDGPGLGQWWLEQEHTRHESFHFHRFGLEDQELNARARQVARELSSMKTNREVSGDTQESPIRKGLREMWLKEYPTFRETTIVPIARCVNTLEQMLKKWRKQGDRLSVASVKRYLNQFNKIQNTVLHLDALEELYATHQHTTEQLQKMDEQKPKLQPPSNTQKASPEFERLSATYDRLVNQERERLMVNKSLDFVLANSPAVTTKAGLIINVIGAEHRQGLIDAYRAALNSSTHHVQLFVWVPPTLAKAYGLDTWSHIPLVHKTKNVE